MNLNYIRTKIDDIDKQLVNLLITRMEYSKEISKIKYKENIAIEDTQREHQILENIENYSKKYKNEIKKIYETIFKLSKKIQSEYIFKDKQ